MPDQDRIERELAALLSHRQYASVIYNRNRYRGPRDPVPSPAQIAKATAESLVLDHVFVDPVEVLEWRGPVELYRVHDGQSHTVVQAAPNQRRKGSAGTLSKYWSERSVVASIWKATVRYEGKERLKRLMEFMLSANFVLPEWNDALQMACLAVPPGATVVVVRGRGNWKAMQGPRPNNLPPISTTKDVETYAGMLAMPGPPQCVAPLYSDMWVRSVPLNTPGWAP
jgi:hypothetical protein